MRVTILSVQDLARSRPRNTPEISNEHGDHLSGKPGNVSDFAKSLGSVGKNLVREKWSKTKY